MNVDDCRSMADCSLIWVSRILNPLKNRFGIIDLPSIRSSNIELTAKQIFLFYHVQFRAYVDVM